MDLFSVERVKINVHLQNEAMTGVFTFNPVFSNITLAALHDSG